MIAIAFAIPQESRDFIAAMHQRKRSGVRNLPIVTGKIGKQNVVVFHTGVGPVSAHERLLWFWRRQNGWRIDTAISAGFAGGLDPSLPAGTLILAENYPEQISLAQSVLGTRVRIGALLTAPIVLETPDSKANAARESRAIAVDMETAALAGFFQKKEVPFLSLRVISDAANTPLPVPLYILFDTHAQKTRPKTLLKYFLRHPAKFFPFFRFVKTIRHARKKLTKALLDLIVSSALLAKNTALV